MDSLVGLTFSQWQKLLQQNRYFTLPQYWAKGTLITFKSVFNSKVARLEKEEWGDAIQNTELVAPPVFILGHWRSGTSMLQNYLALDPQFATPRLIDVTYPNSMVRFHKRHDEEYLNGKAEKRPMDNIPVNLSTPGEDEFALAALTLHSPLLSWVFPRNRAAYDRYLTFEGVDEKIVKEWCAHFMYYLKKLTLTYQKRLLLKSPQHTARLKILLDLFPDAKFIHIHRHPYALFKSTKKLYKTAVSTSSLQGVPKDAMHHDRILKIFTEMYNSFFKYNDLIPKGNYIDIGFEQIEEAPVAAIEKIYKSLNLDIEKFKPILERKVEKNKSYKKNTYAELTNDEKAHIGDAWAKSFEYWNYQR